MREKLLSTREVSHILGISEKEIIELADSSQIPHFKVAGEFLRFKREDILKVTSAIKQKYNIPEKKYHWIESLREFLYFNDFYIVAAVIIITLLWVILKDIILVS